ncbi:MULTISPECIES: hypothetical protein [unclassified Streptomyces]|uniref:hypothetical protein n=1 Tax=unclassified Streptomyces TaxID=2593676 RepID=UPI003720C382
MRRTTPAVDIALKTIVLRMNPPAGSGYTSESAGAVAGPTATATTRTASNSA